MLHQEHIISSTSVNITSDNLIDIGGTTGYPMVKAHGKIIICIYIIKLA